MPPRFDHRFEGAVPCGEQLSGQSELDEPPLIEDEHLHWARRHAHAREHSRYSVGHTPLPPTRSGRHAPGTRHTRREAHHQHHQFTHHQFTDASIINIYLAVLTECSCTPPSFLLDSAEESTTSRSMWYPLLE